MDPVPHKLHGCARLLKPEQERTDEIDENAGSHGHEHEKQLPSRTGYGTSEEMENEAGTSGHQKRGRCDFRQVFPKRYRDYPPPRRWSGIVRITALTVEGDAEAMASPVTS
jgi:hypothetical protein